MFSATPRPLYSQKRSGTHCMWRLDWPQGQCGQVNVTWGDTCIYQWLRNSSCDCITYLRPLQFPVHMYHIPSSTPVSCAHVSRTFFHSSFLYTCITYLRPLQFPVHMYHVPSSTPVSCTHVSLTFVHSSFLYTCITYLRPLQFLVHMYHLPSSTPVSCTHVSRNICNISLVSASSSANCKRRKFKSTIFFSSFTYLLPYQKVRPHGEVI
jgi:hypothetical protein